jgi:hypothetical protein
LEAQGWQGLGADLTREDLAMSLTFINTNKLPRKSASGHGEMTEVLNEALCDAKNVVASLHWLKVGDIFLAKATDKHQLVYLMDGKGRITLNDRDYNVAKGAGAYLGPSETAKIEATSGTVKLFVLVVPKIPK